MTELVSFGDVDFGTITTIVMLLVAFVGWISQWVSGKQQPPRPAAPARRPPRPKNASIQNEIDVFLQEVAGRKKPAKGQAAERVDVVAPRKKTPAARRRPRRPQRPTKPKPEVEVVRPLTKKDAKPEPRVGGSELGKGVREHVTQHMDDRIDDLVDQHIGNRVDQSVAQHLGEFETTSDSTESANAPAVQIFRLLSSPGGFRQAIMISEILSPPISRRPPRR